MDRQGLWKALLWKEFREGWLPVAVFILAPPVLFGFVGTMPEITWWAGLLVFLAVICMPIMLAMWASGKSARENAANEFVESHLPVNPVPIWIIAFLIPYALSWLFGVWHIGWAAEAGLRDQEQYWSPISAALMFGCAYGTAYFLSETLSRWAAVVLGAGVGIFGTFLALEVKLDGAPHWVLGLYISLAAAPLVGSLIYNLVVRRRSLRFRQGLSIAVPILIIAVPIAGLIADSGQDSRDPYLLCISELIYSPDHAQNVVPDLKSGRPMHTGYTGLKFSNNRMNQVIYRKFENAVQPVDCSIPNRAYLVQQRKGENSVRVLVWHANEVHEIARVPAGRDALVDYHYWYWDSPICCAVVRPDGRYMLLRLRSPLGNGDDLWLIDLKRGHSEVVIANEDNLDLSGLRWVDGRVIIPIHGLLSIDLDTLAVRNIDISARKGD